MMKNKILMMFAIFLILGSMSFVSAEMYISGFSQVSSTQSGTTNQFALVEFADTSVEGVGKHKIVEMNVHTEFFYTFPYNITGFNNNTTQIENCTFSYEHYSHNYDAEGNIINTTITPFSKEFNSTNTGGGGGTIHYVDMLDKDTLKIELECTFNEDVDDTIFQYLHPTHITNFRIYSPSFECKKCERYEFEEIITEYLDARRFSEDYMQVFNDVTNLSTHNLEVWYIAYWIIRIFLLLLLVMLVFASVYWLWQFFQQIARSI